jgi:hypothetical protein
MTRLLILAVPLLLVGCVTGQEASLPMALGPSDTAQAACLQIGDAPTLDGCATPASSPTN